MSTEYIKYRVWCNDEGSYFETDYREDSPTTCPNNNSHTIDTNKTSVVDRFEIPYPLTLDGKPRFQETPRPLQTLTIFTSFSDNPADPLDIGGGDPFEIVHTAGQSDMEQVYYMDFNCVGNRTFIYKGSIDINDAVRDHVIFEAVPRTTQFTVSETETSYKLYNNYLIVPSILPIEGQYLNIPDIIDNTMEPDKGLVFAPLGDQGEKPTAYWNADWDSTSFVNITPAPNGDGNYNMFAVEVTFVRLINCLISGTTTKYFDSKDVDEIGHGTRFKITAKTRGDDHDWFLVGDMLMYRRYSV